jgi:serine/threonine-protein kinase HipA
MLIVSVITMATTRRTRARPVSAPLATRAVLEIFARGSWRTAAEVRVEEPGQGIASPSVLEYDFDYLDNESAALGATDLRAVSCRYPVGYGVFKEDRWPAFLLDIIPSGAARRHWESRLSLPNTSGSDWAVLLAGAAHPPGNVRVANAIDQVHAPLDHPGFPRDDILERRESFIEYAQRCGAPVSGSTGAGGDSPKFLLREDRRGQWHADGVLPDERTRHCWLVKFPRTRDPTDELILRAEAGYHRVAAKFGIRTYGTVTWEQGCLFVPRFDRTVHNAGIDRHGLESLCSLAGVADFAVPVPKEKLAQAIKTHATKPDAELREFVARDVLDVALGNTDNHARNTSVLKRTDGTIALSPLYDFAPMVLDRRGIARVSRWKDGSDYPDWNIVAAALDELGLEGRETRQWLRGMSDPVAGLPLVMRDEGVPEEVVVACSERVARVADSLARVTS